MNWPVTGVLASFAIVIGIVLLVVYAVRRGLTHGDLPDTIASAAVPTAEPAAAGEPAPAPRALGALGAVFLVAGLALGIVTAMGNWGGGGGAAGGCAQSWNGCPQVTAPAASSPASTTP